ncbi:MAG: aromatic ring-hydroxylating dioxygenase subunit alpha [Rhodanobacteraceae bacterium]|nr:aromatic ring-hydroxylating dioxygenase subunit alpha [Rhodanobacteraceae bacterium]
MTGGRPDLALQQLAASTALAARFYSDTSVIAVERDHIFARSWQLIAGDSQLSGAGDHVIAEIADVPVLIVRGNDGELRGFVTICKHRAGPIATCDGRAAKVLRCRYHGWTYGLDGVLKAATEMQDAADFEVGTIRLTPIAVATWRGLVFAALDPVMSLAELLAGTERHLGDRDFSHYQFERKVSYPVPCNWKVYADNYLEGYHVPHVHPELNKLLDYRSYITETDRWHSLQYSPMEGAGNFYGDGIALYFYLWPNLMLNILPDRLQTNRIIPVAIDQCRVDFDFFYPPGATPEAIALRERDQRFSDEVQAEDADICERVQRALTCGRYQPGRLNPKRENAVFHFQEQLRHAYRDAGLS